MYMIVYGVISRPGNTGGESLTTFPRWSIEPPPTWESGACEASSPVVAPGGASLTASEAIPARRKQYRELDPPIV
jgi:hypothetical protein